MIEQKERFEVHLEGLIRAYRGSQQVADMLCYHFGYGEHGPARRGKRLRPRLVLRVAEAEGAGAEDALDAAASIEILHNYSLVHDDIEDGDELRHGRRTLWSVYGVPQALNAGDALCALSFLVLTNAAQRHPGDRVLRMVRALHEAHATMCDGQSLDLSFERATHVDLPEYHRMIGAKTAALFGVSSELGALCAPCGDEAIVRYRELGRAYGLAFQIRDDVLGIWGTIDATGKVTGNDIARRKWTFPVVWALGQPRSAARERIAQAYAGALRLDAGKGQDDNVLDDDTVTAVIDALDELGAREAAHAAIAEHLAVVERHPVASVRDFLLSSLQLASS
ncbi:MAG TPA: polyprenyl synthetase family protein [Candidatus Baltobacteraceae bacterium]|nr:polyprenyl synthetase family protein [Candidatus Baltobacteraceae bacterium]